MFTQKIGSLHESLEIFKWHTLSREEQSRYYEMARQQRQLHMQLYPNWTMRDSVASGGARKRRNKRDKTADGGTHERS